MKAHRLWIEIISLGTGVALAFALLIATLGVGFLGSEKTAEAQQAGGSVAPSQQSYEGMITCTHCGAKHSAKINQSASDCTRMCVHGGSSFALIEGEKTYQLNGDMSILKNLAGRRAHIVGNLTGNTINISSVVPTA